jgi:hypothetical protein
MIYEYKIIPNNYPNDAYCADLNAACAEGWEFVEWNAPYFLVRKKIQPVEKEAKDETGQS